MSDVTQQTVEDRKSKAADYRRLLNRWVVRCGNDEDNKRLAELTLACLDGTSYKAAEGLINGVKNVIDETN